MSLKVFDSLSCMNCSEVSAIVFCLSEITEMLPGILNQLGAENLANLKKIATTVSSGGTFSQ